VIEMTIFRTGGVDIAPSAFLPGGSTDPSFHPVWSALLRTTEGNVLFDTGLHPVHVERPDATFGPGSLKVVMAKEDAIVTRLSELGVRPDEIAIVVNSHLHFDHAGNNGAFPKATFLVQGEHLAFAKGKPNFPGVYWDIPELTYLPVAGRARVAPGLEVVPTPGHAPGHQSLVVDLPETGRVVLCGDAAFTRVNLEQGEIKQPDAAAAKESMALIRSLVKEDLDRVFTSHDPASFARWRHAPAVYR
jgi:N-acyl homoserine lactone hydrolase